MSEIVIRSDACSAKVGLVGGIYRAVIKEVECSERPQPIDDYVRLVFWLPEPQIHVSTTLRFPAGDEGRQSMRRLLELCRSVGLTPPLRSPADLLGCEVGVDLALANGVCPQLDGWDVGSFVPADLVPSQKGLGCGHISPNAPR